MNWLKKNRGRILSLFIIAAILVAAYFIDGKAPEDAKTKPNSYEKNTMADKENSAENKTALEKNSEDISILLEKTDEGTLKVPSESESTQEDKYETENNGPEETENNSGNTSENKVDEYTESGNSTDEIVKEDDKKTVCSLSVTCHTINDNIDLLDKAKRGLVPSDGKIYEKQNVEFSEGESVFDVLLREMQNNKIHFEYAKTPIYDGVYIEGINNIYEFDCGARSGWLYSVNGEFPGYSCSQYELKVGDIIELIYTCDMGKDVK